MVALRHLSPMAIEALGDAAVKHGIPRADAYRIVSQMVLGTAKLQLATGQHPAAMKDAVCSPGGATIKGVIALEDARHAQRPGQGHRRHPSVKPSI